MRLVITLKMLNMTIKIISDTFLIRKIAFAMWFSWEIVLHCMNIIMHTKDPSMHNEESKDSIPIILLDTASANAVLYLLYPIPRRLYHVEMPTMRARMAQTAVNRAENLPPVRVSLLECRDLGNSVGVPVLLRLSGLCRSEPETASDAPRTESETPKLRNELRTGTVHD